MKHNHEVQILNTDDFLRKLNGAVILTGGSDGLLNQKGMTFEQIVKRLDANGIKMSFSLEIEIPDMRCL